MIKTNIETMMYLNNCFKFYIDNNASLISSKNKYKMLVVLSNIKDNVEAFQSMTNDLRNTLVEEYGVSNSETGEIEITDEELFNKKYEEEFNKLLRIETILPIEKFNIEELIEIGIKSSDLVPLLPLIEPSEEEN